MANKVNINTTNNKVTVTQGTTKIVTVSAQGPQGVKGDTGPGLSVPFTGSAIVSGSMDVIGRTSIGGPTFITGSTIISGSTTTIISDSTIITGSTTITGSAVITGSLNVSGGITGSIGPSFDLTPIMKYIDTRVEHESSNIISSTTVRFNEARFATAPIGFPPPRKYDFQYYINGVLIPHSNVISIIQTSISVIEIVFDTSLLGYTLESGDIVSVIGKFNSSAFSSGFSNGFSSHAYSFVLQSKTLIFNPNI